MPDGAPRLTLPRVVEFGRVRADPPKIDAIATMLAAYVERFGRTSRKRRALARADAVSRALDRLDLPDALEPGNVGRLRDRLSGEDPPESAIAEALALATLAARRVLGLDPYRVQIAAAAALVAGEVAEMDTGEGKTLSAFLAATVYALMGRSVHVVTANDYLAERDGETLAPALAALGLSSGVVVADRPSEVRRVAYGADVTFLSSKEVAFDYLRDRLLPRGSARRPDLEVKLHRALDPTAAGEQPLQRTLDVAIVDEIDSVLIDEAGTPLIISADDNRDVDPSEARLVLDHAEALVEGLHFVREPHGILPRLTEAGCAGLDGALTGKGGVFSTRLRREELVTAALGALHGLERDRDYLVDDGKVVIVDRHTGRTMADRQWGHDLHAMVEVKEGLKPSSQRRSLASISFQRFFRGYHRLCGMSGTVVEVASELARVYRLRVTPIPRRLALRREHVPGRVFASREDLWDHAGARAAKLHAEGRPVLVAVRSVGEARRAAEALAIADVPHVVLSASHTADEAEIVAAAGRAGQISVVTNMAGRGTDIRLGPGVVEAGGLVVLMCERHESRRIDRQLIGRCGRQGDPGQVEEFVSLDDGPLATAPPWLRRMMISGRRGAVVAGWLIGRAQDRLERRRRAQRLALVRRDETWNRMLAFVGGLE